MEFNNESSSRVFVGNLGYGVTEESLSESMERFGKVRKAEIFTRRDGKSKGCAIVEFENKEDVDAAVLNGQEMIIEERPVFIRVDRKPNQEMGGQNDGGGRKSKHFSASNQIYVGNLAWAVTSKQLNEAFGQFGTMLSCEVPTTRNRDPERARSKGYGLISYETEAQANAAIENMNETQLNDRTIFVRWDKKNGN